MDAGVGGRTRAKTEEGRSRGPPPQVNAVESTFIVPVLSTSSLTAVSCLLSVYLYISLLPFSFVAEQEEKVIC